MCATDWPLQRDCAAVTLPSAAHLLSFTVSDLNLKIMNIKLPCPMSAARLGAQKEIGLLEKGLSAIKQALSSLMHPAGQPQSSYDDAIAGALGRADQKKDQAEKLRREFEEADEHAKELEEQAREARSAR